MPFPIALALGMAAAGGTTYLNYRMNQNENIRNRQFAREQYQRSLQDNLTNWNRENQYNSPAQQMQRLREAGLNPNLVYGKGADNTAGGLSGGSIQAAAGKAITMDNPINAAGTALSFGNVMAQNKLLQAQEFKTMTEAAGIAKNNQLTDIELQARKKLESEGMYTRQFELEAERAIKDFQSQISGINVSTMQHNNNAMEQAKADLAIKLAQAANIDSNTAKNDIETQISELDKQLMEMGISRNSPYYAKFLMFWANNLLFK